MRSMKAIVCTRLGGPSVLRLEDRQSPSVRDGHVKVALYGAGVNFSDLLMLSGHYQEKLAPPFVPGTEGAGIVIDCGADVQTFRPGDRVLVQNNLTRGCYADEVVALASRLAKLPREMCLIDAAGFSITYGTGYFALVDRGHLRAAETLVVHGAAGGVGLAAVQIGKALGARVIATGGDDAKLAMIRGQGADEVINYRKTSFREVVLDLTEGRGADVYFDPVGGDVFDESLKAIAPEGRLIVIGFASGRIPSAPANRILFKDISVIGAPYGPFTTRNHARWEENMKSLFDMVTAGTLKPFIHRTFDLADAAAALESVANREVVGKYVLVTERGRLHSKG